MTPLSHFQLVWARCDLLSTIYGYLTAEAAPILNPDELLRAEWAARISALDLYVHELVAQKMLEIFERARAPSKAYLRFRISNETLDRIRIAATPSDASSAFDLEVRSQLQTKTFQDPEDVADGVRLISDVELWNEIAIKLGATAITKVTMAKAIKKDLSLMVQRRNKIVHEGDLQPSAPRTPWPIKRADVAFVKSHVERAVAAIDAIV